MMMPSTENAVLKEVQDMLARATRAQTLRLLQDILNATPTPKESVKYDA
ncbi:hypothetical protein [Roseobacter sp. CCS2]|nr:hypothetical protein [Roseobacter sp. CCS2]EBA13887.1 hypothetical protein RCCS2_08359 [Roseobacter sp. CCS2]